VKQKKQNFAAKNKNSRIKEEEDQTDVKQKSRTELRREEGECKTLRAEERERKKIAKRRLFFIQELLRQMLIRPTDDC